MINVTNSIYIPGMSDDLYSVHSDMPGKVRKPSPESVHLVLSSFSPATTMSDPTPAQACSATAQQSDSGREVQKLSQCQILDCQGLGHVDNSEVGEHTSPERGRMSE